MSNDLNIIRADDPALWDRIWEKAQRNRAEREAWEQSPDAWEFSERPMWGEIVAREPRLVGLVEMARRAGWRDRNTYSAWYRDIKPQIEAMVGHQADHQPPPFRTSQVYDAVYQYLLRVYETGEAA